MVRGVDRRGDGVGGFFWGGGGGLRVVFLFCQ